MNSWTVMSDDLLRFADNPSALSEAAFVERFGSIYEHSLWVARQTWQRGLTAEHDTVAGLAQALARTMLAAHGDQQLALIRAHPDLAGRAAIGGGLTADSGAEQTSAGLDQCTAEEYQRFQSLNNAYKEKFGFPFIMAVRGSNRHVILAAFEERLHNDLASEFKRALDEINKIARLRLQALAQR